MKRYEGKIADNYEKYLSSPLMIGFKSNFKEEEIIDEISLSGECKGYNVQFNIRYVKLSFGDGKYNCYGVFTDHVDVGKLLGIRSFGSYCHIDEAEIMRLGVVEMCKKHDLMICNEISSWHKAGAIVQNNFYKN